MQGFYFYSPTAVLFGPETERKAAEQTKRFGGSRTLVVYGGGSVVKSGLLGRVERTLADAGIAYQSLGGVHPNPRLSFARDGVKKALEFGADFVLAVGGGSVIDTAKAIAVGAAHPETDIWEFWTRRAVPQRCLPIGVVLTISAAGSETSDSSVLTNEEDGVKRGLGTDLIRPRFAIMNPELTYTLPPYQVSCGVTDIMMHTLDRYFTPTEGNGLTDALAEALLRTVVRNGRLAMADSHAYGPMSELMWAGSLSHNGLTGLGADEDWAVHQLGHELSAKFDVAHGATLAAVWGSWATFVHGEHPGRFVQYAQNVWGVACDGEEAAMAGIEATVAYFRSIGMPTCLSELGIGVQEDAMIRELAERCTYYGRRRVGSFKSLGFDELYEIYRMANH